MKVDQCCKRSVVAINGGADVYEAAKLMRERHVGFLSVFNDNDSLRKPVGVLTDRDVVLQVMAKDIDPHAVTVRDVMTAQPMIASENDEITDLVQAMRLSGIRRVPVVDARGALSGIIALDDLIGVISGLLCEVSGSIKSEQRQEWRARQ
jgi:CBS domain-containing protein